MIFCNLIVLYAIVAGRQETNSNKVVTTDSIEDAVVNIAQLKARLAAAQKHLVTVQKHFIAAQEEIKRLEASACQN